MELLARSLSARDIENAFRDESGRLLLSRTAVSEIGFSGYGRTTRSSPSAICRSTTSSTCSWTALQSVAAPARGAIASSGGHGASRTNGAKVLLHLMAGSNADVETVSSFFQDMHRRGFGDPLLVVSDGAAGIVKAVETCFPRSARQRCVTHRMRNLAAKRVGRSLARGQGPLHSRLPGAVPRHRPRPRCGCGCRLRGRACPVRSTCFMRRLRGLNRIPVDAHHASSRDQDHQSP